MKEINSFLCVLKNGLLQNPLKFFETIYCWKGLFVFYVLKQNCSRNLVYVCCCAYDEAFIECPVWMTQKLKIRYLLLQSTLQKWRLFREM